MRNYSPDIWGGGVQRYASLPSLPPPPNEFCLCGSYGRKGKNLEGLAPCGFLLAEADPVTGGDLTVEQMLCSSEEV